MTPAPPVTVAIEGHVARVVVDRPPHNHLSVELLTDLACAFERIDGDDRVRCTTLETGGKAFCAGADLAGGAIGMADAAALYEQAVRLFAVRKPIVAAIQGAAVGAGLGLALVADVRVAAPEARFCANFVSLGFHPGFGLTCTLPRLIGRSKADLMFLTGRRVKADDAHAWGLVDEIAERDALAGAALRLANEIAQNAPLALMATRATLRGALSAAVRAQTEIEHREQTKLWPTQDFREGVRAMTERRPPRFQGD